jgi:hypothetical protein
MRTMLVPCMTIILLIFSSANALVFQDSVRSVNRWDVLDLKGDAKVYAVDDHSAPPGFGPRVMRLRADRLLLMPKGITQRNGTMVVLYREKSPRRQDADGVLLFRCQYGNDLSVAHNTKQRRPYIQLEQDNDAGLQLRYDKGVVGQDSILALRAGVGIVTDEWNRTGWIWQKVQMDGDTFRGKYWPADKPEPAGWHIEGKYDRLKTGRLGVIVISGEINLAYYAVDTVDIKVPTPRSYLSFVNSRATQTAHIDIGFFTNAPERGTERFEITATQSGRVLGKSSVTADLPVGSADFRVILTDGTLSSLRPGGWNVKLSATPNPGLVSVGVKSASGRFDAQTSFEYFSAVKMHRRIQDAADAIGTVDRALSRASADTDPDRLTTLRSIRDAAHAHVRRARQLLVDGEVEQSSMTFRFAVEALSELSGYRGAWLREIAPDVVIPAFALDPDDRRGVGGKSRRRWTTKYSMQTRITFGTPRISAQSFVMGRRYIVEIPWTMEGDTPKSDYRFSVRLVSPLGNRTVASSNSGPAVPTSSWVPGVTYTQRCTLNVLAENPYGGAKRPSYAHVLDEYHRLLIGVTDPASGAAIMLGNKPGSQRDVPGVQGFNAADVYVSMHPLEITGSNPGQSISGRERVDTVGVRNVGERRTVTLLWSAITESERVIQQKAFTLDLNPGADVTRTIKWTPSAMGNVRIHSQIVDSGVVLTEAHHQVMLTPPKGLRPRVTRSNHVVTKGRGSGAYRTPITVSAGRKARIKVAVRTATTRAFGEGSGAFITKREDMPAPVIAGKASARGDSVTVAATPWYGYYDVMAEIDGFTFDRRLIATVITTRGTKILMNGEPFIMKGTNVHGLDGSSPERTASMMRVLRDLGFNTLRGDYPAFWMMDLAYEMNMGYTLLGPFSCAATEGVFKRQSGGLLATSREISRQTVARYYESAGVLVWNSCNEIGGENADFLEGLYATYRNHDPYQRPVHYANLYGQDLHNGQDIMGVNYYFIRTESAKAKQPMISRSIEIARKHDMPVIYVEFNSYAGAIMSTGAEAMRDMFDWGVQNGMSGGVQYMAYTSTSHPGLFDRGYNTYKVHDDAIIKALADAHVTLAGRSGKTIKLKITNVRDCWLRDVQVRGVASGVRLSTTETSDIAPRTSRVVKVRASDAKSPVLVEGVLEFVTHHGLRSRVPFKTLVK